MVLPCDCPAETNEPALVHTGHSQLLGPVRAELWVPVTHVMTHSVEIITQCLHRVSFLLHLLPGGRDVQRSRGNVQKGTAS